MYYGNPEDVTGEIVEIRIPFSGKIEYYSSDRIKRSFLKWNRKKAAPEELS